MSWERINLGAGSSTTLTTDTTEVRCGFDLPSFKSFMSYSFSGKEGALRGAKLRPLPRSKATTETTLTTELSSRLYGLWSFTSYFREAPQSRSAAADDASAAIGKGTDSALKATTETTYTTEVDTDPRPSSHSPGAPVEAHAALDGVGRGLEVPHAEGGRPGHSVGNRQLREVQRG